MASLTFGQILLLSAGGAAASAGIAEEQRKASSKAASKLMTQQLAQGVPALEVRPELDAAKRDLQERRKRAKGREASKSDFGLPSFAQPVNMGLQLGAKLG